MATAPERLAGPPPGAAPVGRGYPGFWKATGIQPAQRRPGVVADVDWPPGERPLRLVVVGKGGAGKSVIAGTIARLLARRGRKVLALDTDTLPGMAFSLGVEVPATPPLMEAVEEAENRTWKLKPGVGPLQAVERFSTEAPDGVRILQVGDQTDGDGPSLTPAVHAFYQLVHALPEAVALREWTVVGDHPAGPRQTAHDWAPYADTYVVVAEASWKSALTARRVVELADARGVAVVPVASKVTGPADVEFVQEVVRRPVVASVPADEAVSATDRRGVALIDHAPQSPAAQAMEALVDGLVQGTVKGVVRP